MMPRRSRRVPATLAWIAGVGTGVVLIGSMFATGAPMRGDGADRVQVVAVGSRPRPAASPVFASPVPPRQAASAVGRGADTAELPLDLRSVESGGNVEANEVAEADFPMATVAPAGF